MTEVLMRFERDEEKNRINREKHGLSFKLATKVFEDKLRIERYDTSPGNTAGENRTQTIGSIGNVIFVFLRNAARIHGLSRQEKQV